MHIIIVDILLNIKIRLTNVYKSFRLPNGVTPDEFFKVQLEIIGRALCNNCFVMGDFNLDLKMSDRNDYQRRVPLTLLNEFSMKNNLFQIVNFETWSRVIKGVRKESLLDHVYVNNLAFVKNVNFETPTFGDQVLIMTELNLLRKNDHTSQQPSRD